QDHRYARLGADRRQHLEPAACGQVHVEDHEAGGLLLEDGQRARTVGDVVHLEALALESVAHQPADDVVVVDDQDAITTPEPRDRRIRPQRDRYVRAFVGWTGDHVTLHLRVLPSSARRTLHPTLFSAPRL